MINPDNILLYVNKNNKILLIGMILGLLSAVINIISISLPEWASSVYIDDQFDFNSLLKSNTDYYTVNNKNVMYYSYGLFEICFTNKKCQYNGHTITMKIIQIIAVLSFMLTLIGNIITVYMIIAKKYKIFVYSSFIILLGSITSIICIIMFVRIYKYNDLLIGFWIMIISILLSITSSFMILMSKYKDCLITDYYEY